MLRSYGSSTINYFQFGYAIHTAANSNKLTAQDARLLNRIENEINNQISRMQTHREGYIDTTHLDLVINQHLSLIVKNILNQYDIGHFERKKWCGFRKYTIITFDKIIPRIISRPSRDRYFNTPIEQLVSNAVNIKIPITNNSDVKSVNDTYKHDYLNPANKAQARRLRGFYND